MASASKSYSTTNSTDYHDPLTAIRFLFGEKTPRSFFNPVKNKEVRRQLVELRKRTQSLEDKLYSRNTHSIAQLEKITQLLNDLKTELMKVKEDISTLHWANTSFHQAIRRKQNDIIHLAD